MKKPLYIIGVQSSFIVEAIEISEAFGYKDIYCVDNLENSKLKSIYGYPVIYLSDIKKEGNYICCVHTPEFRKDITSSLDDKIFKPASIIHPSAIISKRASISSQGVIIGAGVIIGSNTTIGNHVIINRGAQLGHDISIKEFVSIESAVTMGGFCIVGKESYLGMNATIIPLKKIGKNSIVGAGSVVLHDVSDNTFVAGNPALIKRKNISGYQGSATQGR